MPPWEAKKISLRCSDIQSLVTWFELMAPVLLFRVMKFSPPTPKNHRKNMQRRKNGARRNWNVLSFFPPRSRHHFEMISLDISSQISQKKFEKNALNLLFFLKLKFAKLIFIIFSLSDVENESDLVSRSKRKSDYMTAYACEGSRLQINCTEGLFLDIIRANYGRFSIAICNNNGNTDWSVNCMSPRTLRVIEAR